MVEPELAGLFGKALRLDATRRLRFVVNAVGWLHSVVLRGRSGDVADDCWHVIAELCFGSEGSN